MIFIAERCDFLAERVTDDALPYFTQCILFNRHLESPLQWPHNS